MWLAGLHVHGASVPQNSPESVGIAAEQWNRNNRQAVSLDLPTCLHLV